MKRKILVASFDMAIGGVERSLIGLLNSIDYTKYDVDLMLFKHEGEFLPLVPKGPRLLKEIPQYATFRKPVKQILQERNLPISITRILARYMGTIQANMMKSDESGYLSIQYGWFLSLPFLPKLEESYDVAISFLWPHFFVNEKVNAKKKIGWIHTDYSNIAINKKQDKKMWSKMDSIIAVSDSCKDSFLNIFPYFNERVKVIENIISPEFVFEQAIENISSEIEKKSGRTTIVTVGRLSYQKGLDDAAYACKILLEKGYDIEWYIVGYGPQESELRSLIKNLNIQDRFILLGSKKNPYPYIKACDIYIQPSRYEGKAVTVREAQILNKPVIITNYTTAKSQVKDGVDGIITDMGIDGVVNGVIKLISDEKLKETLIRNTKVNDYGNQGEIKKLYELL